MRLRSIHRVAYEIQNLVTIAEQNDCKRIRSFDADDNSYYSKY